MRNITTPAAARPRARRWAGATTALVAAIALLSGLFAPVAVAADAGPSPLPAAVKTAAGDGFNPELIISDSAFYDSSAMSQGEIQAFLDRMVGDCSNGRCLNVVKASISSRPARHSSDTGNLICGAIQGGTMSVAAVIHRAQTACGISAKVILVTLQKEQGLVTSSAPSEWNLRAAMGAYCPDTAPCDPAFAGIGPQIIAGTTQLKVYRAAAFARQPGRHFIGYHPNESCGGTTLNIRNHATAALYNYTPYQPNGAALRAGFGTGDSCSSYGNRNFFNYYTRWFGSPVSGSDSAPAPAPAAPGASLVQGRGRGEVFLVANGTKHHVPTMDVLHVLRTGLGGIVTVPAATVDGLPSGHAASRYVHDSGSGTLYLLEGDGSKHRFASVDQVALFGYDFPSYVNLEPKQANAFRTGADVDRFVQPIGEPEVYSVIDGTRRHIADPAALSVITRGTSGYIASIDPSALRSATKAGSTYFEPNTLVREASSGDVYLTTPTSVVVHIPSFSLAGEFGAHRYSVVADGMLARNNVASSSLSATITCDGEGFIATAGSLRRIAGEVTAPGLPVTALRAIDCAAMPKNDQVSPRLFVRPRGLPQVYLIEDGVLRHVRSYDGLLHLNGDRTLRILEWAEGTADWAGYGPPVLARGDYVRFEGSNEVYVYGGEHQLRHVRRYETLIQRGGGTLPRIEVVPAWYASWYPVGAPLD